MTMIAKTFFDNPDFVSYVRLLGELHRLIQQGRDEEPEGDDLRDRMDAPGERLSREELAAVKGIAADFYSLAETRDVLPADAARAEDLVRAVARERESGRLPEALELARQCEGVLPPVRLAEVRAAIWQAANEPKIAQMFFEGAAHLQRRPHSLKTES
jgi:enoyl-CoA hydratase/carnithine racemase